MTRRTSFLLGFFVWSLSLFAQPTYLMKDTVVTTCSAWVVDEGGYTTGYSGGAKAITLISPDNRPFGFHIDSLNFADGRDNITIYDGSSMSAALIATITNEAGPRLIKTSAGAITIRFSAAGYGTTSKLGFRAEVTCLSDPERTQFTTMVTALGTNNADVIDYDKDGDIDILQDGAIFRNDTYSDTLYYFEKKPGFVGYWRYSTAAKADFDGDGDNDIFVIGEMASGLGFSRTPKLFLNDGAGNYTSSSHLFANAFWGDCIAIDLNKDGKTDISYIGQSSNTTSTFRIYLNNGDGTFTEKATAVQGLSHSSMDWGDYDGDGDLDLLTNGDDLSSSVSKFYVNEVGSFVVKSIGLRAVHSGEIQWVDINKDGKPDIVNTGVETVGHIDAISPQILTNKGDGTFASVTNNLPQLRYFHHVWKDYDNDGDPDVLINGIDRYTNATISQLHKNTGIAGLFEVINLPVPPGATSMYWKDFNNDGREDIFIASRGTQSYWLKNVGNDSFNIASWPLPGIDLHSTVLIDDVDNDGVEDLLYFGITSDYDCWVPGSMLVKGLGRSNIPMLKFTKLLDLSTQVEPPGFGENYWRWGDFDNDGLIDVLVTCDASSKYGNSNPLKIYKNNGNNNFTVAYNGRPGNLQIYHAVVVDIDNDSKNELFIPPNNVYRWNQTQQKFNVVYETGDCFCWDRFVDFADYNNDGFIDCAVNGNTDITIFRNDHGNKLVPVSTGFTNRKFLKWADLDADGDLDIVGSNGVNVKNVGDNRFVFKMSGIQPSGHAAVGDFNFDKFPDVFALTNQTSVGSTNLYYNQNGSFFFVDKTPSNFPDIVNLTYNHGALSLDFDNDGDQDILYSGGFCKQGGILMNYANLKRANIHVSRPNGSEIFAVGSTQILKWNGKDIQSPVTIYISTDSGRNFAVVANNINSSGTGGTYNWMISGTGSSKKCILKIADKNGTLVDQSDRVFEITQVTSINERLPEEFLEVYPNPVTGGMLNLKTKAGLVGKLDLVIFDVTGQLRKKIAVGLSNTTISIDVSGLSNGFYMVKYVYNKKYYTKKFLKM